MALLVTEPTITGIHDLERILAVAEHFGAEPVVCINKHDLNPEAEKEMEAFCQKNGVEIIGRTPFHRDRCHGIGPGSCRDERSGIGCQ